MSSNPHRQRGTTARTASSRRGASRSMKYASEPAPPPREQPHSGRFFSGSALLATIGFGVVFFVFAVTLTPVKVTNSIAHMTPETVALAMQPAVGRRLADRSFTLLVEGKESRFRLGDYDFTASPAASGSSETVSYKDSHGKTKEKVITTVDNLCFNETAVRQFINDLAKEYGTPMIEPHYTIEGDTLTVFKGTDGVGIKFTDLIAAVVQRIQTGDDSPIELQVDTLTAPAVDIDKIYEEVRCEPANADFTIDSAGNPKFTADIVGKDFDLAAARQTVAEDSDKWKIKLTLTYPELDLKTVRAPFCLDELSFCTTSYTGSSNERAHNVEQAARNINTYGDFTDGYILQPGEEFSFNGVVGKRTAENGFMKAPVYISTGSTEDYGGGICQVSTTLYCAALYANLDITERHNHLYVIHYWPTEGCDATVDWGHLDFKFRNNKEYPIKITFSWEKRKLTATISGTEDGITAKMSSEVTDKVPYQVHYKHPNTEHPNGSSSGGDRGMTVKVWRTVYQNGERVSKEEESNNLYNPLDKTVYTSELPEGAEYE
ncbi:MAG: VanW family protein [Clostridia bacterium]|nr:VanW family protein [Clostridia bacterium]